MTNATHPIFQALADALCPPLDDEGRLGKHLDSVEIEAAPAPIPDDTVYRMALIEWIDKEIAERNRMIHPGNAFYWSDTAVLAQLKRVREFVCELEGGE